ncbi:MAG: PAS domain-containing protein [Verrucomicrobiota bacterium]|jgi:PAS domain S-box-containing protein
MYLDWVNPDHTLWSARHLLLGVSALCAAVALGLVWVGLLMRAKAQLQRRVAKRTGALQREVQDRRRVEAQLRESQALYLSLIGNLPRGIYRKDLAGRYTFANPQFCRLHDLELNEILGRTVFDIRPPERAAESAREDETVLRTGNLLDIEKEDPTRRGDFRYLNVLKIPVFDAAGKLVGTQGMITDITQRRLTEVELDSERALMRSLLDNSPDHIFFKDLQSRFIKTSRKHAEQFGLQAEDVLGKTDFDFFDDAHANPAFEEEQEIIRTGVPLIGKVQRKVAKDKSTSWALITKMPLRDKSGRIIGTFGISKDITAIKETEARFEQIHRQLLDTSRMAGMAEVATSVLHNVGNVLNSVNVSSSVLADKMRQSKVANLGKSVALMRNHERDLGAFLTGDPKGRQLLGYLENLAGHMVAEQAEMLKELASLTKNIDHIKEIVAMQQSYSKVSGICEIVPPSDLVEDALRMNGAALDRHQIELVREYSKTPPILVEKHKVLQILVNLIRNAKYACDESGRPDKRLTVRVGLDNNNHVAISIIDNGVGIPAENLARIFNHGFTTRRDGHGFGLHSGALNARELGGSLNMRSEGAGQGAEFTLELPLQPPRPAPAADSASPPSPGPNGDGHPAVAGRDRPLPNEETVR